MPSSTSTILFASTIGTVIVIIYAVRRRYYLSFRNDNQHNRSTIKNCKDEQVSITYDVNSVQSNRCDTTINDQQSNDNELIRFDDAPQCSSTPKSQLLIRRHLIDIVSTLRIPTTIKCLDTLSTRNNDNCYQLDRSAPFMRLSDDFSNSIGFWNFSDTNQLTPVLSNINHQSTPKSNDSCNNESQIANISIHFLSNQYRQLRHMALTIDDTQLGRMSIGEIEQFYAYLSIDEILLLIDRIRSIDINENNETLLIFDDDDALLNEFTLSIIQHRRAIVNCRDDTLIELNSNGNLYPIMIYLCNSESELVKRRLNTLINDDACIEMATQSDTIDHDRCTPLLFDQQHKSDCVNHRKTIYSMTPHISVSPDTMFCDYCNGSCGRESLESTTSLTDLRVCLKFDRSKEISADYADSNRKSSNGV